MANVKRRELLGKFAARQQRAFVAPPTEQEARNATQARYFPNVELTTHEGKTVRFYDDLIKDKIVVVNFMYAQ